MMSKPKANYFVAKGSSPWYNDDCWRDIDKVTNVNKSIPNQATVTCNNDVTDMNFMFIGCYNITALDLSNFDASNVTDMAGLFKGCSNLVTLDLSNLNTSNVKDMSLMFEDCRNLTTLNLSSFDTSNVTAMHNIFDSCSKLTSVDISNFDTSNVTEMWKMFYGCSNLTTIKGIIDMKSCENYEDMFYNCPKLRGVKIKNPPAGFESVSGLSKSQYTVIY